MAKPVARVAYTIEETIAITGLGRTRLYEEIRLGRLKAVKAGKRTLVPVANIEAWLKSLPPFVPGKTVGRD